MHPELCQMAGWFHWLLSSSRHVFTNFWIQKTKFFTNISQLEKKFLTGQNICGIFFLSFENLRKSWRIVNSYSENSWKHVLNLTKEHCQSSSIKGVDQNKEKPTGGCHNSVRLRWLVILDEKNKDFVSPTTKLKLIILWLISLGLLTK